jgi:hypothetical protein
MLTEAINESGRLGVVDLATCMPPGSAGKREFMVIIEQTDKSKRGERERLIGSAALEGVLNQKIINFEQGRRALEKGVEEQNHRRLIKGIRFPGGRPYDWLELLLTMAMLFALLLGLYVGLIGP